MAVVQGFIGATLVVAGLAKVRSRSELSAFLSGLVGRPVPTSAADAVIVIELVLGSLLLARTADLLVAPAACLLTTAFVIVQVASWRRGTGQCHCFGAAVRSERRALAAVRAVILASASYALLVGVLAFDWPATDSAQTFSGATVAGASILGAALLERVQEFNDKRPHFVRMPHAAPRRGHVEASR